MPTYIFLGRILPEREPVTINIPEAEISIPALNATLKVVTFISKSQVASEVFFDDNNLDVDTLRNIVDSSIRSVLDLIGYERGLSFDLEVILAVRLDTNQRWVFAIEIPILAARRAKPADTLSGDLLKVVGAEPAAHLVLADFREAMRVPIGTGFFCYRAIESMMQSMKLAEDENESTVSWPRFRETLHINRGTIMEVQNHAKLPRHGKPSSISDAERAKIFQITDEIIRRYLQHLLFNREILPESKYPEL